MGSWMKDLPQPLGKSRANELGDGAQDASHDGDFGPNGASDQKGLDRWDFWSCVFSKNHMPPQTDP